MIGTPHWSLPNIMALISKFSPPGPAQRLIYLHPAWCEEFGYITILDGMFNCPFQFSYRSHACLQSLAGRAPLHRQMCLHLCSNKKRTAAGITVVAADTGLHAIYNLADIRWTQPPLILQRKLRSWTSEGRSYQ